MAIKQRPILKPSILKWVDVPFSPDLIMGLIINKIPNNKHQITIRRLDDFEKLRYLKRGNWKIKL